MVKKKRKILFLLFSIVACLMLQGMSYSNQNLKTVENKTLLSSTSSNCDTGLVTASVLNVRSEIPVYRYGMLGFLHMFCGKGKGDFTCIFYTVLE